MYMHLFVIRLFRVPIYRFSIWNYVLRFANCFILFATATDFNLNTSDNLKTVISLLRTGVVFKYFKIWKVYYSKMCCIDLNVQKIIAWIDITLRPWNDQTDIGNILNLQYNCVKCLRADSDNCMYNVHMCVSISPYIFKASSNTNGFEIDIYIFCNVFALAQMLWCL